MVNRAGTMVIPEEGEEVSAGQALPQPARELIAGMTPQQVALFAAMLVNGGNVSRSARAVGMNESYARRLVSQNPLFREALRAYGAGMRTSMEDWLDLVPRAKATLLRLLHDPDGRTRFLAAQEILNRAEGKPVSKMDLRVTDERQVLSEGEVQLAMALMRERGISYPQAVEMIRSNPEDAAAWVEAHAVVAGRAALPAGEPATPEEEALPLPQDGEEGAWEDAGRPIPTKEGED